MSSSSQPLQVAVVVQKQLGLPNSLLSSSSVGYLENDLFLSGVSNFNQLPHDSVRDEVVPLELLADLKGNVERPNAHK